MTLDEAMRLCRLVRAFKDNLSHNASLLRRIVRSLDAAPPGYGALQESTLDFVEQALLDVMDANVGLLLDARQQYELPIHPTDGDDDDSDAVAQYGQHGWIIEDDNDDDDD